MTLPSPALPTAPVRAVAEAGLPTEHGTFRLVAFDGDLDGREHVALVHGELGEGCDVLVRLHSECLTGDAVILYLRQEGRGIGLTTRCGPMPGRTGVWTRSTPTAPSASPTTSATMRRRPACCGRWACARCGG